MFCFFLFYSGMDFHTNSCLIIRKIEWPFGSKKLSKYFSYWNIIVLLQLSYLIYHEFYQFSTMVYDCFRNYYIWFGVLLESFPVQVCFGALWRLWSILELKIEKTHSCSETSHSRHSDRLSLLDSDVRRRVDLFEADLNPDDPHNYKTASGGLLPNIYSVCHCLGKIQRFYFLLFIANNKIFSRFGEKIQDSFKDLYWNSIYFLTILYAFYSVYYHALLDHVWVVSFVRFRVN